MVLVLHVLLELLLMGLLRVKPAQLLTAKLVTKTSCVQPVILDLLFWTTNNVDLLAVSLTVRSVTSMILLVVNAILTSQ